MTRINILLHKSYRRWLFGVWQCRIWFAHQTKQIPFRLHRSHTSVAVRTHPLRLHTRTRVPPSRPFIFSPPNRVRFCIINLYSEYNFYFGFRVIYNDAIDALRNWYMVSTDTHNTQHQQKKKKNKQLASIIQIVFFFSRPSVASNSTSRQRTLHDQLVDASVKRAYS